MSTVAPAEVPHRPGPMLPAAARIARRRRETGDTWTLDLVPVDGPAPAIGPGQFMMVYAFGVGEVPISVSGGEGDPRVVHTVRAVGAVTEAICASRPGTVLGLRGPFGNAWPVAAATGRDVVIVAGGIGLAPLRPVLYHALAHRAHYGRVVLLYGARTPRDLLFTGELEAWRRRDDIEVLVTVDAASASWRGAVGVVPQLLPRATFDPARTSAFVCGPEVMMRFSANALVQRGVDPGAVHVSMERAMKCGVGLCGHCQLGPTLICRDGPVYGWDEIEPLLGVREL